MFNGLRQKPPAFGGQMCVILLVVPGALLFTREMNNAISKALRTSRPIKLHDALREEIFHWLFLRAWDDPLPWRDKHDICISLARDTTLYLQTSSDVIEKVTRGVWWSLMALDSNSMTDQDGSPLPHFTPHPSPQSWVSFFAQGLSSGVPSFRLFL